VSAVLEKSTVEEVLLQLITTKSTVEELLLQLVTTIKITTAGSTDPPAP
jgi:hypothetical protein